VAEIAMRPSSSREKEGSAVTATDHESDGPVHEFHPDEQPLADGLADVVAQIPVAIHQAADPTVMQMQQVAYLTKAADDGIADVLRHTLNTLAAVQIDAEAAVAAGQASSTLRETVTSCTEQLAARLVALANEASERIVQLSTVEGAGHSFSSPDVESGPDPPAPEPPPAVEPSPGIPPAAPPPSCMADLGCALLVLGLALFAAHAFHLIDLAVWWNTLIQFLDALDRAHA